MAGWSEKKRNSPSLRVISSFVWWLQRATKMHVVANKLQLTLAILKPDCMACPHIISEIRRIMLENEFWLVRTKMVKLSREQAEEFYSVHQEKFFYNRLVTFMCSGPIGVHVLAREDAINTWRKLLGPTKVLRTVFEEPTSIRGRFGLTDTRNCAHGSDSEETANKEIQFFFPEIDIDKFREEIRKFLEEKGTMLFNEKSCEHECHN
ncbi:nucleoside diphosphate kinase 6 isoform X1 [Octopus sinensis]|uniref:Nucleoside diphosphate kinase n=1 Tax=Octopus sinensis TaxID=2607531 RepID=A0A7E6F4W5_9MOLL|nr:nucleoside diphosphate kinase 6 isoform X1 [Octopus sinensis]